MKTFRLKSHIVGGERLYEVRHGHAMLHYHTLKEALEVIYTLFRREMIHG